VNADDVVPADIVIDILLSMLAKPSALLRNVIQLVFKAFSSLFTETGLSLLLNVRF